MHGIQTNITIYILFYFILLKIAGRIYKPKYESFIYLIKNICKVKEMGVC